MAKKPQLRVCRHQGFTILEVTLAMTVLLSAMILLSQFLIASGQQRRVGDQRRLALEELSNRMERVLAAGWEDLNEAAIEKQPLSLLVLETLPDAKLTARVTDEAGSPEGKQIRLEISWEQGEGRITPLGLTAWRFHPQEAKP
jgi:type II secretory pathway component PulJ